MFPTLAATTFAATLATHASIPTVETHASIPTVEIAPNVHLPFRRTTPQTLRSLTST